VKILLEAGANASEVTYAGVTPLALAERLGMEDMVGLLKHHLDSRDEQVVIE